MSIFSGWPGGADCFFALPSSVYRVLVRSRAREDK